ncbi:helix-turn-helix domain-containing protein [Danxiaibacter flavus]|uniref:Helix-turn-helix domain-containing protein n=1 Tax=Danxiaibacter flavus TaxID=3049108 RepID=A0ABV3ZKH7_9BACT|nr:helix-turn-helix domain-containing protein [Chitinophagaceae bacterium DXS]
MVEFLFHPVTPHPALIPYVAKMWVFESSGRLPAEDMKLIVPNANFKLTLTCKNGMVAQIDGRSFTQKEDQLSLSGLIDRPVVLDPSDDMPTSTIVIELNPIGVYRLFHLPYAALNNQLHMLPELLGKPGHALEIQLGEAPNLAMKLHLLQQFLLEQLHIGKADSIYDYCVNRITQARGIVTVSQLEKATGYSARWLHRKFSEHMGTGAKNFAEIVRFKQCYQVFSSGVSYDMLKTHIYEYYHDQSHFLRSFKRFTGSTPTELQRRLNELATKHYTS